MLPSRCCDIAYDVATLDSEAWNKWIDVATLGNYWTAGLLMSQDLHDIGQTLDCRSFDVVTL